MRRIPKPRDVFDRDAEWDDLVAFASSPGPGLRLGIVSGRRRQGKSFLLRRLCEATSGIYAMALEQDRVPALTRFAEAVAAAVRVGPGSLRFDGWDAALRTALDMGPQRGASPRLVVIDELPYLLRHSPELPSVIQEIYDDARHHKVPAGRLILCGSALSVMTELLSGTRALRGRAVLDQLIRPFDYRTSRRFWEIDDPQVAFAVDAVLGGTPGYRDLIDAPPPKRLTGLGRWLAHHVLNPGHALFGEADYLLREDPRVSDRALYHSVLGAISEGARTPAAIAQRLGRPDRALSHPLEVLRSAGFIRRDDDVLLQRRPTITVADPIVRFQQLVVRPRLAQFEERRAEEAWSGAAATFSSNILGPHFETLARTWCGRFASEETLGAPAGEVGRTVVNDRSGRARHEVDVVMLAPGQRRQSRQATITALGEAKASSKALGLPLLDRLERIRDLLGRRADVEGTRLLIFGRAGFDRALTAAARMRADVVLVDLDRLYDGE
ncbi:MAG: AAA family ATPase [Acidimicrobiales bacterium]